MKLTANKHAVLQLVPTMLLVIGFAGCGDDRVVQVTREADNRQAEQNREIARVVNEETVFRQEAAKLQNDLRSDQAAKGFERADRRRNRY